MDNGLVSSPRARWLLANRLWLLLPLGLGLAVVLTATLLQRGRPGSDLRVLREFNARLNTAYKSSPDDLLDVYEFTSPVDQVAKAVHQEMIASGWEGGVSRDNPPLCDYRKGGVIAHFDGDGDFYKSPKTVTCQLSFMWKKSWIDDLLERF
jgi:hypothetical protein